MLNSLPPRYSVVIPMFNAEKLLRRVLSPLQQLGPEWEVVVVDDCSTDLTAARIFEEFPGFALYSLESRGGQARARNLGVEKSRGSLLFFVDSDVVVSASTLQSMAQHLESHGELDGVFGCYSASRREDESHLSRFRNLQHRFVHRRSRGSVRSFWTGLGAIRRCAFAEVGGFDPDFTGIEDVELGKRVADRGGRFWLDDRFEGQHLKNWTLSSMVWTDLWIRAVPWTFFALQGRMPRGGLNLSPRESAAPLLLAAALATWPFWPGLTLLLVVAYLAASGPRYLDFYRAAGPMQALTAIPFLAVHHLLCLLGAALGGWRYLVHRLQPRPASAPGAVAP